MNGHMIYCHGDKKSVRHYFIFPATHLTPTQPEKKVSDILSLGNEKDEDSNDRNKNRPETEISETIFSAMVKKLLQGLRTPARWLQTVLVPDPTEMTP